MFFIDSRPQPHNTEHWALHGKDVSYFSIAFFWHTLSVCWWPSAEWVRLKPSITANLLQLPATPLFNFYIRVFWSSTHCHPFSIFILWLFWVLLSTFDLWLTIHPFQLLYWVFFVLFIFDSPSFLFQLLHWRFLGTFDIPGDFISMIQSTIFIA